MVKLITILLFSINRFSYQHNVAPTTHYKDSTISVFGDKNYQVTLHVFNEKETTNETINNCTITFQKKENGKNIVVFRDSLFSMHPQISLHDYNNDGSEDVIVFYNTGARANPTYHLYITNLKNHTLNRVKGFEELPNPHLDTDNNIIISIALSGPIYNYYSFYRINSKYKLINLGHEYEEEPKDSTQFERAIRAIIKKK